MVFTIKPLPNPVGQAMRRELQLNQGIALIDRHGELRELTERCQHGRGPRLLIKSDLECQSRLRKLAGPGT